MSDKDFVRYFIRVYREMPALWKVKSESYKNKQLKRRIKIIFLGNYPASG
jgi:hypothetical protein